MGPFASCFCNIPKGSILVASMKSHWSLLDREQTVQLRNMRCSLIICKLSADLQGFILVFFRNLDFRFFRETFIFFVGVGIKLSLHGYIGNRRGQRLLVHVIKQKKKIEHTGTKMIECENQRKYILDGFGYFQCISLYNLQGF